MSKLSEEIREYQTKYIETMNRLQVLLYETIGIPDERGSQDHRRNTD